MSEVKSAAPTIVVFEEQEFNLKAAQTIASLISGRLAEGAPFCSLGLSGGSTPGGIYGELAKLNNVAWERVKLFLGDERWVNETDPASNTRMIRETLLVKDGAASKANFFPPDTTLDCATGAVRYADTLIAELGRDAIFDVMLLGVGDDGHTASIFPGSELLHRSPDLCAVARHPQNHSTRITVSRDVLERSRQSVFMAKGAAKASIIKRILSGDEPESVLPVKMFHDFAGSTMFLLDTAAQPSR